MALVRDAFAGVPDDAWDAPAGALTWTCWETIEHAADDLFAYAAQLATSDPAHEAYLPIVWRHDREGGPASTVFVKRTAGTRGLLQVLDACGAFLSNAVAAAPADRRAYHPWGLADPEGFAAMGVVEVVVHAHDVALGLGRGWQPPADLCARVLHRLFPDAPRDEDPWPTLLWATGRGELPGRPLLATWRWDGAPQPAARS